MAKLIFTQDELAQYFNNQLKHAGYDETVQMATDMCIHAEGIYPKDMIEERRPSESLAVKEYRQKIWKPITKPIWSKVITELNKIRRSSDWSIKYDDTKISPRIIPSEVLKVFCEEKFPFFTSVTNWVFKVLLPGYCKDANSVVAVMPVDFEVQENEYVQPFGYLYTSQQVIDFKQNDYAVIKSMNKVVYMVDGAQHLGDVYYIFTTLTIQRWEQVEDGYVMQAEYIHNIGKLPVFKVEGLFKKALDDIFIFESRLSSMLPRLDEALREYSDLQAEVVQNVYSEKWEMISDDCPKCKGKGIIKSAGFYSVETTCPVCDGTGAKPRGPYTTLQVRPPMAGETPLPTPPAGYLQKTTDIVTIQDARIDKHEYKALSAINMEYLAQTPLNQSGLAKEVDQDSLNNFVHSIAEDIVSAMDNLYFFINEYRYLKIVTDPEERKAMLPYVNVPEKFDLLSSTYLEDQLSKFRNGEGNQFIIVQLEKDYVNKKFEGDNATKERVLLSLDLDPLTGLTENDKMARLSNKGITQETYIISSNVQQFIQRAIDEKGNAFFDMTMAQKKALMLQYAQEQIQQSSAAAKVLNLQPSEKANPLINMPVTG